MGAIEVQCAVPEYRLAIIVLSLIYHKKSDNDNGYEETCFLTHSKIFIVKD
mgnify:FL=1